MQTLRIYLSIYLFFHNLVEFWPATSSIYILIYIQFSWLVYLVLSVSKRFNHKVQLTLPELYFSLDYFAKSKIEWDRERERERCKKVAHIKWNSIVCLEWKSIQLLFVHVCVCAFKCVYECDILRTGSHLTIHIFTK